MIHERINVITMFKKKHYQKQIVEWVKCTYFYRGQLQGSVQDKHSLEQQYGSFIQTSKDLEKR